MTVPNTGDQLSTRTAGALADGSLDPADLERLLDRSVGRRRPDVGGVLRALGVLTVIAGAALAYIIRYRELSTQARQLTPFVFPAVILVAAAVLGRLRRPRWEVELAALVGEITLALALIAAEPAWPSPREYGEVGSVVSLVVSLAVYRLLRVARLATWAAAVSLVALMQFAWSHPDPHTVARTFLVEGVVAAVAGLLLLQRARRIACQALYLAALLGLVGGSVGSAADEFFQYPALSVWVLALFVTTLLALTLAALLELNGLLWLGACGALLTLGWAGDASRRDQHWVYLVVAAGIGLALVGTCLHRLRRPAATGGPGPQPAPASVEPVPPNG